MQLDAINKFDNSSSSDSDESEKFCQVRDVWKYEPAKKERSQPNSRSNSRDGTPNDISRATSMAQRSREIT
jgi:hypothetical protein|tara:strand:+ start:87 stop:299 length:213 start_codon:yes stop_codon:yes gene_type:complete